jgi:hypothetical protein
MIVSLRSALYLVAITVESLTCLLVFCHFTAQASPPAELTVEDVWRAATERQEAIRNMRVEYDVSWKWFLDTPNRKKANASLDPYSVTLAFDGERRYCKSTLGRPNAPTETSFDGERSLSYDGLGKALLSGSKESGCEDIYYCVEFLFIPLTDGDRAEQDLFYPRCLHPPASPRRALGEKDRFFMLPAQEEVDGVMCHVLEYPNIYKIWIDPKIGCAIRRRDKFSRSEGGSVLTGRVLLKDYKEVAAGLYLPMNCVREDYAHLSNPSQYWGKKTMELHVAVRNVSVNGVTDDDFGIELPPGTTVFTADGSFSTPGDRSAVLNEFAELAKERLGAQDGSASAKWRNWVLVAALIAIFVISLGKLVLLRRSKTARM